MLGQPTPLKLGLPDAVEGEDAPNVGLPDKTTKNTVIDLACKVINQQIGLADDGILRGIPVPPQTTNGPFMSYLGVVPGLRDRSLVGVRRAWWNDGSTNNYLYRVDLGDLDRRQDTYINSPPAVPYRFAVEGYNLYLDPPPALTGTFQYMASCGVLSPTDDSQGFDCIPEDYDPCVLFIALVNICKVFPADAEMTMRAQSFSSDAAAGLERLSAWFRGLNNEENQAQLIPDTRTWRRGYTRR